MFNWANIKIRNKLVLFSSIIGIVPLLFVAVTASIIIKKELIDEAFQKLKVIQVERRIYIEKLFADALVDIEQLSDSDHVKTAFEELSDYGKKEEINPQGKFPTHTDEYRQITSGYDGPLRKATKNQGFYNLFLISYNTGQILYSVEKETEPGTNLNTGPLRNSGLAELWRNITEKSEISFIDFKAYSPSNNRHSAFIGNPVYGKDGKLTGIIAVQLTSSTISRIVQSRQNMGTTGESYLLSWLEEEKQFELRSNLVTMGDGKYIVGFRLDEPLDYWSDAKKYGRKGHHGIYEDSSGNSVLVAYNSVSIGDMNWYLISKINEKEVSTPILRLLKFLIFILSLIIGLIITGSYFFSKFFSTPLLQEMSFARSIAEGDLSVELSINRNDEFGELAKVLNDMSKSLYLESWLKSGKEGLDDVMRGDHNIRELASRFISFFVKHSEACLGAVYLSEQGDMLKLVASYSFSDRENNFNQIKIGEGLVGQAALEQKTLYFTDAKDDAPNMNIAIGERKPKAIMAAPLIFEGEIIGAFLVGSMTPFSDQQKEFAGICIDNVAILFKAALSRETIKSLLTEAEMQQEELRLTNEELEEQALALKKSEAELQAQQEELRVTNEELEEQTRALKKSEAELQAQQEELRVTNEELEERTKALEEQSISIKDKNIHLEQIRKEVEKKAEDLEVASKYKSEFLANMSHELRTPLNSILILSKIFEKNKDGNLTRKQLESANAIHSSGSDLLRLINEILDLSKVEAGKLDLHFEDMEIGSLCNDLGRLFNDQAKEKGISFRIDTASDVPKEIHTDSHRLQQILRNLLANAFKFSQNGDVKVSIVRPSESLLDGTDLSPENSVAFSVEDNGIGIPGDKQADIFEAFRQANGGTSREYGGTGLGLSISRALTRALGGIIKLYSVEGKGSTFTVILPDYYSNTGLEEDRNEKSCNISMPQESAPDTALFPDKNKSAVITTNQPSQPAVKDDREGIEPGDKTILLIEDDPVFLEVMADLARESGFKCIVATDGETGLGYAETYKPSAIILDVGLPGIDGWTVMERLKDNSSLRHIPVHFISGSDSAIDAMRMGAIGYLVKPVTMENMTNAFDKIENTISREIKNLLVVEDDEIQQQSIKELIGNNDVKITTVSTGEKAYQELSANIYDCMVLDLGLSDMSGFELLEKIKNSTTFARVPIIIYTGKDLTREEESELNKYAGSIIIKGVRSPERLLDETSLFLHRVESQLPEEKQQILKMVHNKEEVLKNKNVLLVDDDMRNVFALSSIFEEHQMNVSIARNGIESLERLEKNPDTDIVLMDIMMPQMDGYEAMKKIREQKKHRKLPIIALTAKAMKGDRTKCIEAGASDYLAKPVNVEKLISMLRVWLYR